MVVVMKFGGALFLIAFSGLQLALTQDVTDCTDIAAGLDTMPIDPVTVPDLPVCVDQRGGPQCCSTQFILDQLNTTEENFLEGLRIELQERFQTFDTIVDRLRAFLEGDFLTSYFASFGNLNRLLRGGNALLNGLLANLRARIDFTPGDDEDEEMPTVVTATATATATGGGSSATAGASSSSNGGRSGFNVRRLLGNVVSSVASATVRQYAGQSNAATAVCIRQVIGDQVQQQKMDAQAAALQQIRRVMASIDNLREFISNFTDNLAGFRPLQQCIDAVVRLNTCGRCVAVRPPFCQNVCAAIARACYSPFNNALEDQLEVLWEVVRRILDAATDAIGDLNANRGIFNLTEIASQISANCQIDINLSSRGPRQSEDDDEDDDIEIPLLPAIIRTAAIALRGGPFNYIGRRARGPGLCRLLNTSRTNCFDGNGNRTEDIEEFDRDDIEDQVNNPVIMITQPELTQQAASLGAPVTAALSSSNFAEVAPVGLAIPAGDGQTPGDNNGGPGVDGNNGAAAMFVTLTSVIVLVMASFFVA